MTHDHSTSHDTAARLAQFQHNVRDNSAYSAIKAREQFLDRVHAIMEAEGISR